MLKFPQTSLAGPTHWDTGVVELWRSDKPETCYIAEFRNSAECNPQVCLKYEGKTVWEGHPLDLPRDIWSQLVFPETYETQAWGTCSRGYGTYWQYDMFKEYLWNGCRSGREAWATIVSPRVNKHYPNPYGERIVWP